MGPALLPPRCHCSLAQVNNGSGASPRPGCLRSRHGWTDALAGQAAHGWTAALGRAGRLQLAALTRPDLAGPAGEVSLAVIVREARTSADFRGVAAVRAHAFHTYPSDRTPYGTLRHQKILVDQEWAAVEARVSGRDAAYAGVPTTALVAVVALPDDANELARLTDGLDPSCRLPAAHPHPASPASVIIGGLDLCEGRKLPSEALTAHEATAWGTPRADIAYLSNVCVAVGARRRGVGGALVRAARTAARKRGIARLYVHAAANNAPAVSLYLREGFLLDAEEREKDALALGRPRRVLLRCDVWADLGLPS